MVKQSSPKPRNKFVAVMIENPKPQGPHRRKDKIIPRKAKHKNKPT